MCGHCTERAALAARLSMKSARSAAQVDPLLLPVHLQEARDWRQLLAGAPLQDDLVVAIVALCRLWSERGENAADSPLQDPVDPDIRKRFDLLLAALDLNDDWSWLREVDGARPIPLLIEAACEELDAYLAGWLHVQSTTAPAWDEATLHERLPRLSTALDLLVREAPGDDRLVMLALSSPGAASPFSAIDLWLQRRATRAVIAHHGMAFVLPLLDRWRSGALLSVVLRDDLQRDALWALRGALAARRDDGTEGTRDLRTAVELALAP